MSESKGLLSAIEYSKRLKSFLPLPLNMFFSNLNVLTDCNVHLTYQGLKVKEF